MERYAKPTRDGPDDARRIGNSLCCSYTLGAQGGKAVSRRGEKLQRVLVDVPGDVAKDGVEVGVYVCVNVYERVTTCIHAYVYVRAGLLELGSAYLRCTMHSSSPSLPTPSSLAEQDEASRERRDEVRRWRIPRYRLFAQKPRKKNSLLRASGASTVGGRARTCKREREEKMVRKVDVDIDIGLDGRFRTECGLIHAATRKRMIPENGKKNK